MEARIKAYWETLSGNNTAKELDIRCGGSHFVCLRCGDEGYDIEFQNMDRHCNSERHKDADAFVNNCIAKNNLKGTLKKNGTYYTFKCGKCLPATTLKFTSRTCASQLSSHCMSKKHGGKPRRLAKRAIMEDLKRDQKKIKT